MRPPSKDLGTKRPSSQSRHVCAVLTLFVALGHALLPAAQTPPAAPYRPPNVLFIAIDDLNDWVACLDGHPQAFTPHIDRLATRGVNFTNAHCQAPICQPSRTSLLTGTYPFSNGVYDIEQNMRDAPLVKDAVTIPEYFQHHGYTTLAAGKIYHRETEEIGMWTQAGPRFGWTWMRDRIGPSIFDFGPVPMSHQSITRQGLWHKAVASYLACVTFTDHCVGRLLDSLDRSPYVENTIIILWSDHGFHLGEKMHWEKRSLWEESTRVPLLISVPPALRTPEGQAWDVATNARCHRAVELIDLYPTLIAGLAAHLPSHEVPSGPRLPRQRYTQDFDWTKP